MDICRDMLYRHVHVQRSRFTHSSSGVYWAIAYRGKGKKGSKSMGKRLGGAVRTGFGTLLTIILLLATHPATPDEAGKRISFNRAWLWSLSRRWP